MNLSRLYLDGFKSFGSESCLQFPKHPGLYYITGRNEAEPDLGANAVGKSTLIADGLCWGLFGKTARGLRAGDVASWFGASSTSVTITCREQAPSIYRSWKPNKLLLGETDTTQEELEAHLGFSYETFLYTVLMGQFSTFFFDLSATEKLNVFSRALDLDFWMEAAKKAHSKVAAHGIHEQAFKERRAELEGVLATLRKLRTEHKKKRAASETERKARRAKLEEEIEELKAEIDDVRTRYVDAAAKRKRAQREADEYLWHGSDLAKDLQKVHERREEIERGAAAHDARCDAATRLIELLDEKKCGTCGQAIKGQALEDLKRRVGHTLNNLERSRVRIAEERGEAEYEYWLLYEETVSLEELVNMEKERIDGLDKDLSKLKREESLKLESLKEFERELMAIDAREAGEEMDLAEIRTTIREARKEQASVEVGLTNTRRAIQRYEFWKNGFKDLRLWIVESALAELEVEINASLVELGLLDWRISLSVERETKGGKVARGFHVHVQAPTSNGQVPWEAWSGGETQRLRIAGAVGFANLVRNYRGIELPVEVWDEPTQHMSSEGVDDLLRFFADRARQEHRQIWLVDHVSFDSGLFDRTYIVVKDEAGSRVEED